MKKLTIVLVVTTLLINLVPRPALAQEPVQCAEEYTVQAGDWLSRIAEKYFGDVLAFDRIVTANNASSDDAYPDIANPDVIEPGLVLCLPADGLVAQPAQPEAEAGTSPSPELVGPSWLWQQTLMNNGDLFAPDDPSGYIIQFQPDGTAFIQADCNQVRAGYTVEDNLLTIEPGPSTLVACPEGSLGDQFVMGLTAANSFFFDDAGDLLIDLKFDSGTMRFSPQSNDLAGSNWIVTSYNNGQEAVVNTMTDTELTANFGTDGRITGNSGCNNYSAGFTVDGNNITIEQGLSTMMACIEPEGVMDQEQEFLAALASAATYQITGNTMQMRTADDALAATFMRAPASAEAPAEAMPTEEPAPSATSEPTAEPTAEPTGEPTEEPAPSPTDEG
ncbi:MAG: META domain-containing protein [Anaerolineae bacterium]|nr:META domain-containing protein [Anaerolineae bacterium]